MGQAKQRGPQTQRIEEAVLKGPVDIRSFKAPDGRNLKIITIPRHNVENGRIDGLVSEMRNFVSTKESAQKSFQNIWLSFDGYDHDPRELWEVEEMRRFHTEVTREIPWWAHLPARKAGTMGVWMFCITPNRAPTKNEDGSVFAFFNRSMLSTKLQASIDAVATLYDQLGYSETEKTTALNALSDMKIKNKDGDSPSAIRHELWWGNVR